MSKNRVLGPSQVYTPVVSLIVLLLVLLMSACGGGSSNSSNSGGNTPPPGGPVAVTIAAASTNVTVGNTIQLTATVSGTTQTTVTWSVDGVAGGNATVGTISPSGLYTAPGNTGQHTITATSTADTNASGTITITVVSVPPPVTSGDITVDFNSRAGGPVIPPGLFGSQLGNVTAVSTMQALAGAGISGTRLYANVQSVFATPTPNWAMIDTILDSLQAAGMKATLMIAFTPAWLQPTPNPCSEPFPLAHNGHPYNAAPTDNNAYASIAAQYVAHISAKYPGLVQYYEIWNEADEPNVFCGLNAGDSSKTQARLDEYKALYKAVAIAMKQQAATSGVAIMVGGPALGNTIGSNFWISQLVQVTNGGARLVDFVSYHQYLAGSDVSHTMTWDGAGGTPSLYSRALSPTSGIAAAYKSISAAAASGGSKIPVMLDEYNDDWDFFNDCCKNSPTFSPVFNTMVFSLLMNTAYTGAPPLQHLSYYSASNQPFCMLGFIDAQLGCGTAGAQLPYPQFRAFELLASPAFLGLQASGGNLAKSISKTSAMTSAGLVATAFYTSGSNAVVLVNPLATPISNAVVVIGNHGLNNPVATQFLLNSSSYSPTAPVPGTPLPLAPDGANVQTTVTIPPFSVLAIKVTGQ